MDNTTYLAQLCRLCVQNKGNMRNIFSADVDLIEFNVKLYCCVPSIKIDEPTLPTFICHNCIKKLRYAFAFRQQCIDSTRILINKYQSINIREDDVEMIDNSDFPPEVLDIPDIKQEIVENLEDSFLLKKGSSCNEVLSRTEDQTNEQLESRINKETFRIFTDLARIEIESMKQIETFTKRVETPIVELPITQELRITPVIEDTTSRIEDSSDVVEDGVKIEEPTIMGRTENNSSKQIQEFPNIQEATSELISTNIEDMSSEFNNDHSRVIEEESSTNNESAILEAIPSRIEDVRIRSPKTIDDASSMFEDESSTIEGEASRIEEDHLSVESPIVGSVAEDSSRMIDNEPSRIEDAPLIETTIEDTSIIEEEPPEMNISTTVVDFPRKIEDESSRINDSCPITTDTPIVEEISTVGEEPPGILIMPTRTEEEFEIEAPSRIADTVSQFEDIEERNSEMKATKDLAKLIKISDLEVLISNAFKTLQPTEDPVTGYSEQNGDQFNNDETDAVDDLINENIVEDRYENEHDHTYCKHYDKEFEEQVSIKIEIEEDVNQETNEEMMNESLNLQNMEPTNMEIQSDILEPIEEISQVSEEPMESEVCNKNFTMEKSEVSSLIEREVGNFTAKKCEKLNNDSDLESPYICTSCDRGFNTINKLRIHLRTHIIKYKELCKKCGSNITTRKSHRCCNITEHNCSYCSRTFKSAAGLFKHKYHKHIKGYVCSFCSERFTDSRTLNKHVKTHADDFNKIAVP